MLQPGPAAPTYHKLYVMRSGRRDRRMLVSQIAPFGCIGRNEATATRSRLLHSIPGGTSENHGPPDHHSEFLVLLSAHEPR